MNLNKLCWKNIFLEKKKKLFELMNFIKNERLKKIIYPPKNKVFRAFTKTSFNSIKVVIIGQDPYHQWNQANGLSFSVEKGIKIPPSLKNIYQELKSNIPNVVISNHGCLSSWANQGVFLLNSVLTVEHSKPGSHFGIGWECITNEIIQLINEHHKGIVFLLWGKYAQKKKLFIDSKRHYILEAPHPSPFSVHRGFFGCRHFSKTNKLLKNEGKNIINWSN